MNPTPLSPQDVSRNPEYEVVTDYQQNSYWPSASEIVVKHKKSGTYWEAVYRVFDCSASWREVVPATIVVTKFVPKPEKKSRKKK